MDQSSFAAPHGLSQRSTSFIASQRQGIRRTPLRHLIALIINVHTLGRMLAANCFLRSAPSMNACIRSWTLIRKTSLLHKIGPMARRSSFANKIVLQLASSCDETSAENDLEIVMARANCFARSNSDRSPLYDVRNHACCSIRSGACETVLSSRTNDDAHHR